MMDKPKLQRPWRRRLIKCALVFVALVALAVFVGGGFASSLWIGASSHADKFPVQVSDWPGVPYSKVVAYQFKTVSRHGVNGKSDVDALSAALAGYEAELVTKREINPAQAQRIMRRTMNHTTLLGVVAMCYDPHHALVCFSPEGKPVAVLEICLSCGRYRLSPAAGERLLDYMDTDGLKREFADLGLRLDDSN